MNKRNLIAILLILLLVAREGHAQFFPVQATFYAKPPYPVLLSDYANPQGKSLTLKVLLRDLTLGPTQVYFRFRISSNRVNYTNLLRVGPVFTLTPGITSTFTQADFGTYFNASHLSISPFVYAVPLSEGVYTFSVEIMDALTNKALSKVEQAPPMWLVVNDPPILNLPLNNSSVKTQNPQNLIFQWTPRHRQASTVEYEFTLTELLVPDNFTGNLQNIFLSQPAYYQTTVTTTSFLYGPALPPLIAGRLYGFRVRAKAKDGFEEVGLFRNNGYSEIFIFRYGESNRAPRLISARWDYDGKALLTWDAVEQHTGFEVQRTSLSAFGPPPSSFAFDRNLPPLINNGNNTFSAKIALSQTSVHRLRVGGITSNPASPVLYSDYVLLGMLSWANIIKGIRKDYTDYLGLLSGKSRLKNPIPLLTSCDKPAVNPTNTRINPIVLGDTIYAGGTLVQVISNEVAKAIIKTPSGGSATLKLYYSSDFKINQFNEVIEGYLSSEPTNHRIQLINANNDTGGGDVVSKELKRLGIRTDSLKTLVNQRHDYSLAALQTGKVGLAKNTIPEIDALLSQKLNSLNETLTQLELEISRSKNTADANKLQTLKNKLAGMKTETQQNIDNLRLFVAYYNTYPLAQLRVLLPYLFLP
jgi:hypothetical protein